jgi:hypothetical protein
MPLAARRGTSLNASHTAACRVAAEELGIVAGDDAIRIPREFDHALLRRDVCGLIAWLEGRARAPRSEVLVEGKSRIVA